MWPKENSKSHFCSKDIWLNLLKFGVHLFGTLTNLSIKFEVFVLKAIHFSILSTNYLEFILVP